MKKTSLLAFLTIIFIVTIIFARVSASPSHIQAMGRGCDVCTENLEKYLIANPDFELGRGKDIWIYGLCEQEAYIAVMNAMGSWNCDDCREFVWERMLEHFQHVFICPASAANTGSSDEE